MKMKTMACGAAAAACILLLGCAGSRPSKASQYKFTFDGEQFLIRSIYSENRAERQNELIGSGFLAVDRDQDRILDYILFGKTGLGEAQHAYEYGLAEIEKTSGLRVIEPQVERYTLEDGTYRYEIKSFRPPQIRPFNEFIVTEKNGLVSSDTFVFIDRGADGTIDEVSKGTATLEKFQPRYTEALKTGLRDDRLSRIDQTIVVKKR